MPYGGVCVKFSAPEYLPVFRNATVPDTQNIFLICAGSVNCVVIKI